MGNFLQNNHRDLESNSEHYLIRYYNREMASFMRNLDISSGEFDKEAIHDMRVAAKRIKAILQLFQTFPEITIDQTKLHMLDEVFKTSGKLRENHINQSFTEENSDYESVGFNDFLKKTEKKREKKYKKAIKSLKLKKLRKFNIELEQKLGEIKKGRMLKESYKRIKEVLIGLKEMINVEEMHFHRIRTQMNNLRALCEFSNELQNSDILSRIIDQLNSFHKMIGRWHDEEVFLKTCEKFMLKIEDKDDDLKRLYSKIKEEKLAAEKDIITELRVFAASI